MSAKAPCLICGSTTGEYLGLCTKHCVEIQMRQQKFVERSQAMLEAAKRRAAQLDDQNDRENLPPLEKQEPEPTKEGTLSWWIKGMPL